MTQQPRTATEPQSFAEGEVVRLYLQDATVIDGSYFTDEDGHPRVRDQHGCTWLVGARRVEATGSSLTHSVGDPACPADAVVDNAVAAALTDTYGFLPLNIRYGAAAAARRFVNDHAASADAAVLPRDWVANEVGPDTPYVDEPSEMVPTGVYLLGGFTADPEDGPQLMFRVEHALDDGTDDGRWTPLTLAQAAADRLNGGVR